MKAVVDRVAMVAVVAEAMAGQVAVMAVDVAEERQGVAVVAEQVAVMAEDVAESWPMVAVVAAVVAVAVEVTDGLTVTVAPGEGPSRGGACQTQTSGPGGRVGRPGRPARRGACARCPALGGPQVGPPNAN